MLSALIIARRRARLTRLALVAFVGVGASACQKVALLAPSGSTITLTASATTLPLNGTTTLLATIVQNSGYPPHSDTQVTFTTTLGTVTPATAATDTNGQVSVQFNAGSSSGTATITATSGGATGTTTSGTGSTASTSSGSNVVKIAVGAAAVGTVAIAASPGTVSANGGSSTVTASVRDSNGNALASVPVTFTTDNGSLSAAVVSTDTGGNAQATITTNKTAKVTATAGVSSTSGSTTTSPSASVTINVNTVTAITVTASTTTPIAGQNVAFTLAQGSGGTAISRTVVDFGDTTAQSYTGLPTGVTHTYAVPGTYLVRVTATDQVGDTASGSAAVTVSARPQPTVGLTFQPTNPTSTTTVTFTVTVTAATGTTIQNVTMDFGDGSATLNLGAVSGQVTVQHKFPVGSGWTVTVIARDSSGTTGSAATVIVVGS